MQCRRAWNPEFLSTHLTKAFINTKLRRHREQVLFERERALLPATQPLLQEKRNQALLLEQLKELKEQRTQLKRRLEEVNDQIMTTMDALWRGGAQNHQPAAKEHRFTYACPAPDCKGFVDNATHECPTCNTKMCPTCHEIALSDPPHTCNPDTVETIKQLKRDTKPCPNCHALIHKIVGCNQMFCTKCHHVFNWVTGLAERGPIHNPEWYDLQARLQSNGNSTVTFRPRDPADFPCGGLVHWPTLSNTLLSQFPPASDPTDPNNIALREKLRTIGFVHRIVQHMEHHDLPRFRPNNNLFMRNAPTRIEYLENRLTDDEFKRRLVLSERAHQRQDAIHALLHMFTLASQDIFRRLDAHARDLPHITTSLSDLMDAYIGEFYVLQDFYWEHSYKISSRFNNCAVPSINIEMGLIY